MMWQQLHINLTMRVCFIVMNIVDRSNELSDDRMAVAWVVRISDMEFVEGAVVHQITTRHYLTLKPALPPY